MADIEIRNEGSIVMFTPLSDHGRNWHQGRDAHRRLAVVMGESVGVDHRFANDIVQRMSDDGLEIAA
jgi:hypothetical protein